MNKENSRSREFDEQIGIELLGILAFLRNSLGSIFVALSICALALVLYFYNRKVDHFYVLEFRARPDLSPLQADGYIDSLGKVINQFYRIDSMVLPERFNGRPFTTFVANKNKIKHPPTAQILVGIQGNPNITKGDATDILQTIPKNIILVREELKKRLYDLGNLASLSDFSSYRQAMREHFALLIQLEAMHEDLASQLDSKTLERVVVTKENPYEQQAVNDFISYERKVREILVLAAVVGVRNSKFNSEDFKTKLTDIVSRLSFSKSNLESQIELAVTTPQSRLWALYGELKNWDDIVDHFVFEVDQLFSLRSPSVLQDCGLGFVAFVFSILLGVFIQMNVNFYKQKSRDIRKILFRT